MTEFIKDNILALLSFILGGGSLTAYIFERKKNNALTNQEVSKSDQEKITTADKAIDLVNKLSDTMDEQFEEMKQEITTLKQVVKDYQKKCDGCPAKNQ